MTTSTKVNSFTILKTKNQFILLCWKKQLWRMCTNFWINPHNGKLPSRLAPTQCQNSLAPQLLSNIYWSKTKTSISLNRVYWYDTMCHIFSCLLLSANNHILIFYSPSVRSGRIQLQMRISEFKQPRTIIRDHPSYIVKDIPNIGTLKVNCLQRGSNWLYGWVMSLK